MGLGSLLNKAKQAVQSAAKAAGKAIGKVVAAAKKAGQAFSRLVCGVVAACGKAISDRLEKEAKGLASIPPSSTEKDKAKEDKSLKILVPNYGNWCGSYRSGLPEDTEIPSDVANGGPKAWESWAAKMKMPPPVDGVDRACLCHDFRLQIAKKGAVSPSLKSADANARLAIDFYVESHNPRNTAVARAYAKLGETLFPVLALWNVGSTAAVATATGVANAAAGLAASAGAFSNAVSNGASNVRMFMFGR